MNVLVVQIVLAVATVLLWVLRWQWCCRHHRRPERRVVPVRQERRSPVPYVSRVGVHKPVMAARTVSLTTLPMPIKGTIEPEVIRCVPAEVPTRPSEIRFATPDAALMRRVIEGLRALPDHPRDTG